MSDNNAEPTDDPAPLDAAEMRIFISARSSDYGVAGKIAQLIRDKNPAVEVNTGQNIRGGERWYKNLLETLKRSNVLIAIHLGADDQGSYDWLYQEAGWFVREEEADEPVIPLYPGEKPPAGLDMYQGYSMGSVETAKEFLETLFVRGLKRFTGINPGVQNLEEVAEDLVHTFAVGSSTPLVDLFPFRVSMNEDGTPADVRADGEMMKKVGRLEERSSWEKFTKYHHDLPSHGINAPDGWVEELEDAFRNIYIGTIFKQPTQPLQSAVETGERFLPVIRTKLTRDDVVESIGVQLIKLAEQIQVGGRIFRVLAMFEQLQSDVLSRLKKWGLGETPEDDEWVHIKKTVEVANSLINEMRDRATDVSRSDTQVIRIDDSTLAGLLGYVGRGLPSSLRDAAESRDHPKLLEGLEEFDNDTGRIWIATARAYVNAVESVMGSNATDE